MSPAAGVPHPTQQPHPQPPPSRPPPPSLQRSPRRSLTTANPSNSPLQRSGASHTRSLPSFYLILLPFPPLFVFFFFRSSAPGDTCGLSLPLTDSRRSEVQHTPPPPSPSLSPPPSLPPSLLSPPLPPPLLSSPFSSSSSSSSSASSRSPLLHFS